MSTPNSAAGGQGAGRSARSKRASSGGGVIASMVGPAHPAVDVVAPMLPVAGLDGAGELDGLEPLQRLIAVHGRDIQAGRAPALPAEGPPLETAPHQHR